MPTDTETVQKTTTPTEIAIKAIENWQQNRLTTFTATDILHDYGDAILSALRSAPATPGQSRTICDPFLGKEVEISNNLTDRLRGKYANGPTMPNGGPEFGWRQYPVSPIHLEAAAEIERLQPYVAAFRREEDRADKFGRELDDLREQVRDRLDSLADEIEKLYHRAAREFHLPNEPAAYAANAPDRDLEPEKRTR